MGMNPLKKYLQDKKESEYAFAKRAEIPQPTVWRIASGQNTPTPLIAEKIEKATNGKVTRMQLLYPEKST